MNFQEKAKKMTNKSDSWERKLRRKEERAQLTKTQSRSSNIFSPRKWDWFKTRIPEIPISKMTLRISEMNCRLKERKAWLMRLLLENSKFSWREKSMKLTRSKINFMRLLKKLSLLRMKFTSSRMSCKMKEENLQSIKTRLRNTSRFSIRKKISLEAPKKNSWEETVTSEILKRP